MRTKQLARREFMRRAGSSAAFLALMSKGMYSQAAETSDVRIPLGTGLEDLTKGDWTVETWFRTTDPGRHVLLGNWDSGQPGVLNLELHTDNRVRVVLQPQSSGALDLNVSADAIGINTRDGEWHHLAATRSEGWVNLYVDGIKVAHTMDSTATHPRSAVGPMVSDRTIRLREDTLSFAREVPRPRDVKNHNQVEFGVISDVHLGVINWKWPGTGYVELDFVKEFVEEMTEDKADFIIQLGDFCKQSDNGEAMMEIWNGFDGPVHNVLGNHERDGGHRFEDVAKWWGMPHRFYTFDVGRIRGIILDANEPGGGGRGYAAFVGPEQREWLAQQLSATDRPVIIFVHQPIEHGIRNGDEVRAIIEAAEKERPGTVVAVIAGHAHKDYAVTINSIPYIQINSASYKWYDRGGGPIRYSEPVWGRVYVDFGSGELRIKGRTTGWLTNKPWEHGAADGEFALSGENLFIGSDTRTGETRLNGSLDNVRIWRGGLWDDAIIDLASGLAPSRINLMSERLMAEYSFETSGGSRVRSEGPLRGQIDDSADFESGPFHGLATGSAPAKLTADVPPVLGRRQSRFSANFGG